jgi:signal peptidase II
MSEHITAPQAEPAVRARLRVDVGFFLIALAVFALDQATKVIVRHALQPNEAWPNKDWLLNIINVSNSGAAFGILQGQTMFLVVTSLVGVAAIVLYYMYPPLEHGLLRVALALQLGGAAGNLIDRVRTGEVTDFINFRYWPAFNVADSCISIGVATIFVFFLFLEGERYRGKQAGGG